MYDTFFIEFDFLSIQVLEEFNSSYRIYINQNQFSCKQGSFETYMKGIHTQIDALTNHMVKNISEDYLKNVDTFNMIFQKMIFQSLKLVSIVFDQTVVDQNLKVSFQKFIKQLKNFAKKRPDQEQSDDQFFNQQFDEVTCFLNNRKPVMTNDEAQRGDIYKFLSQAESKQKDMKQFIQNSAKFASQKKLNRLMQSSKKLKDILMIQKQIQTQLGFEEMNKLSTQIQKIQRLKLKEMIKNKQQSKQQQHCNQNEDQVDSSNHSKEQESLNREHQTIVKFQINQQETFKNSTKVKANQKQVSKQGVNVNNKKGGNRKSIFKGRNSIQNGNQIKKVLNSQFKDKTMHKQKGVLQNKNKESNNGKINELNNFNLKKQRNVISEGDQILNSLTDLKQNNLKSKQKFNLIDQNCNLSQNSRFHLDSLKKQDQNQSKAKSFIDIEIQTQIVCYTKQETEKMWLQKTQNQKKTLQKTQNQANKVKSGQLQMTNSEKILKKQRQNNKHNKQLSILNEKQNLNNKTKLYQNNNSYNAESMLDSQQKRKRAMQQIKQNHNFKNQNFKHNSLSLKDSKQAQLNPKIDSNFQENQISKFDITNNSKNNIILPNIKKQSNFNSLHAQNNKSLNLDRLKSIQNNRICMPKIPNKTNQINISQQDNKIIKELQRFVKQNSVKANINKILMYVQFFETMHIRQCGQNCIHLHRFYQFLNKKNIPTRKQLMMHKTDISKTFQL